jgi:hypothetical protein
MTDARVGDIAFSYRYRPSLYDRIVRIVTRSKWTHNFCIIGEVLGEAAVFESNLSVSVSPFRREYIQKTQDAYEIYRPVQATGHQLSQSALQTYWRFAGVDYGFLSLPWFIARALLARFGIRLKKNWASEGVFCSELVCEFLRNMGGEYEALVAELDGNAVSPADLYDIVLKNPHLFVLVGERQ